MIETFPCPTCLGPVEELSEYVKGRFKVFCVNPVLECSWCGQFIRYIIRG